MPRSRGHHRGHDLSPLRAGGVAGARAGQRDGAAEAQEAQGRAAVHGAEVDLTHTIIRAPIDGIVVATPIYNYDASAAAKNLVELTGRAWQNKVVGFLCAAGGDGSYMSIMALANSLMLDFRCVIVPRFVYATGGAFAALGSRLDVIEHERARKRQARADPRQPDWIERMQGMERPGRIPELVCLGIETGQFGSVGIGSGVHGFLAVSRPAGRHQYSIAERPGKRAFTSTNVLDFCG